MSARDRAGPCAVRGDRSQGERRAAPAPDGAAVCCGIYLRRRRATKGVRGTYWLQTQGPDLDNGDIMRASLNALEPSRTG
jgi:hypothetical protein